MKAQSANVVHAVDAMINTQFQVTVTGDFIGLEDFRGRRYPATKDQLRRVLTTVYHYSWSDCLEDDIENELLEVMLKDGIK